MTLRDTKKLLDLRWLLIMVSVLAALWLQVPRLTDEFRVDQDFRTFYWMNKFQTPDLFPNDDGGGFTYLAAKLFSIDWIIMPSSPGYGLLFFIASYFVTPVLFSKLLVFIALPITVWYLTEFGKVIHSRGMGIALALAFIFLSLASPSSLSIVTGLQRSLANSLMIILIYYLHQHRYVGAAFTLLICTLFYPPMFVLGAITWGLHGLYLAWSSRFNWTTLFNRGWGLLIGVSLLSMLIMSLLFLTAFVSTPNPNGEVGEQSVTSDSVASKDDNLKSEPIWDNPVFQKGGQAPLFFLFPLVGRGGLVNNGEDLVHILILFCLSCLIVIVRGPKAFKLPNIVWCLLWSSFIGFILAWTAIWLTNSFPLHMPSRYTRVGLFISLLVFVIWNGQDTIKEAMLAIQHNPKLLPRLTLVVTLLALILIIFYPSQWSNINGFNMKWLLAPTSLVFAGLVVTIMKKPVKTTRPSIQLNQIPGASILMGFGIVLCLIGWAIYAPIVSNVDYLNPPPAERALLDFLKTVPKDSLIAGTPCLLDNVPLFARRQVLFNCDLIVTDDTLIRDALTAYYADDPQEVVNFCRTYHVDYLVIDTQTYLKTYLSSEKIFFEPYDQELRPRFQHQDQFVIPLLPDENRVFQAGDLFVASCDDYAVLL